MEERKQKEIAYYDEQAQYAKELALSRIKEYSPVLESHKFLYNITAPLIAGKKVLDYGCGEGIHIPFLARHAKEIVAIDLSQGALEIAKRVVAKHGLQQKVTLLNMDCEKLEFSQHSFDVVFDGGTFSSLDFSRAIEEITRVLRPEGVLVGIETFGHNPLANTKRVLNRMTGTRTSWAASHIVRQKELERLRENFAQVDVYYFHLASLFAFPLLGLPGGSFVLGLLERVDQALLRFPFLQKYAFKMAFICKNVKKTL